MTQKSTVEPEKIEPWYKHRWPWILIAIPLLTVTAGVTTLLIAINGESSLVVDDYFKQGLAINQSIDREKKAEVLNIHGVIRLDRNNGTTELVLDSKSILPISKTTILTLSFYHPTQKEKDFSANLSWLSGTEFRGHIPIVDDAFWYYSIEDKNKQWLIKGRWRFSDTAEISF